ncbi:hypothetical protein AL542_17575 [Grimontia hollisae]|uniref:TfoX N-terminal domain-containing protein n=2 Tax=Grimontia hollisae TaxID=673 RepID=D0IAU7_GRIHO|nr:hypothetical protein [Grimontia hollisae]AMG31967.1 hypothetical protein AL542_17575 [Grimontia hollisae]EEY71015.1 hypothetical protein VHA_002874 [Grimontia hollisae CIP 101886]MDF2184394.1 hypothetical protein [Grimontia hollisae]STO44351.1 Uncharacterised protein [Grimontia hollisae]STO57305.1 Uncharacterised protein [Grimontia hollisae]
MRVSGHQLSESVRRALLGVSGIREELDNERFYFYQYGRLFGIVDDSGLQLVVGDECMNEALRRPGALLEQPSGKRCKGLIRVTPEKCTDTDLDFWLLLALPTNQGTIDPVILH